MARLSILAVFAHPDDEVLAAGATMARYAREGHDVHIAILGEGITSRFDTREDALQVEAAKQELDRLRSAIAQAARIVGAGSARSFPLPDNRFDSVDLLDVIKVVEKLKSEFNPDVVLTHHAGDMNVDHGVVTNAVLTAFRSLPGEKPCAILSGEVLSSTDYSIGVPGRSFEPNVWVPVSDEDVHKKVQAMSAYVSEARAFPHPRSKEAIESLATLRGAQCGVARAEAFRLLRSWGTLPGVGTSA